MIIPSIPSSHVDCLSLSQPDLIVMQSMWKQDIDKAIDKESDQ